MRDFQAMIDRGGPGQAVGEALLEHAQVLFAWWHWVRDGNWARSTFQQYVSTLRASFRMELEWGSQGAVSPPFSCFFMLVPWGTHPYSSFRVRSVEGG